MFLMVTFLSVHAGINDSSKVLECFLLLRDTVLHALNSKHPSNAFVSKPRTCWQEETSDQRRHQPVKETQEKMQEWPTSCLHQSPHNPTSSLKPSLSEALSTPSPFSMVSSSGFVSLADEEILDMGMRSATSSHSITTDPNPSHRQKGRRRQHLQNAEEKSTTVMERQKKVTSHQPVTTTHKSQRITDNLAERTSDIPQSMHATPPQVLHSKQPAQLTPHGTSLFCDAKFPSNDVGVLELELEEKKLRWIEIGLMF